MRQASRIGGVWRDIKRRYIFQGGSWRPVRKAFIYVGGQWRQYYNGADPISITFSENPLNALSFFGSTVTGSVTAQVVGGAAPYLYTWGVLSFDGAASPTISGGTTATPIFTQTGVASSDTVGAVFRVTVTDSSGLPALSADLQAYFTHENFN